MAAFEQQFGATFKQAVLLGVVLENGHLEKEKSFHFTGYFLSVGATIGQGIVRVVVVVVNVIPLFVVLILT